MAWITAEPAEPEACEAVDLVSEGDGRVRTRHANPP